MRRLISELMDRLRNRSNAVKPSDKFGQAKPHISGAAMKEIVDAGQGLKNNQVTHEKNLPEAMTPTHSPAQKYGGGNDSTPPPARGRSLS